jgi:hypothetical protein
MAAAGGVVVPPLRTLNIPEQQILANLPGNLDGKPWHHLILVVQIKKDEGRWAVVMPSGAARIWDIGDFDVEMLDADSPFPAGHVLADDFMCYDNGDILSLPNDIERARGLARINGATVAPPDPSTVDSWIIFDVDAQPTDFGKVIFLNGTETIHANGTKGMKSFGVKIFLIKKVIASDLDSEQKAVQVRFTALESRILPIEENAAGDQERTWRSVCESTKREENVKLAIPGPSTVQYCADYFGARGGPVQSIRTWMQILGLNPSSYGCSESLFIAEVLEYLGMNDQYDITNSSGAESLCRKLQTYQHFYESRAREREHGEDATGSRLDSTQENIMMGRDLKKSAIMYSPKLREYFTEKLVTEVNTKKWERKNRDERLAAAKSAASSGSGKVPP